MSRLEASTLSALWCRHAGLGQTAATTPRDLLARTGWVRTLGGVDAYLSLRARCPSLTVADVHGALAERQIEVVPAARGCIYLVARDDAPLARALARDQSVRRMDRERAKAGFPDDELERVSAAVCTVLAGGPASTTDLRKRLPDGVVRSLGASGKKVGLSSTLPPTVRALELAGTIVRRPLDHRLDHEQYEWVLAPAGETTVDPRPAAERDAEVVRRMLGWLGPTSIDALATFSGLGKRALKTALKGDDIRWHASDRGELAALDASPPPAGPAGVAHFLPGLDTLLSAHGGPGSFVADADAHRPAHPWGRQKGDTWGTVQHVLSRPIVVDGRIAGAWEVDPDARSIAVTAFHAGLPADLDAQVAALRAFVWDQLGHGRAFSIDTPSRIRKRRDLLAEMA